MLSCSPTVNVHLADDVVKFHTADDLKNSGILLIKPAMNLDLLLKCNSIPVNHRQRKFEFGGSGVEVEDLVLGQISKDKAGESCATS